MDWRALPQNLPYAAKKMFVRRVTAKFNFLNLIFTVIFKWVLLMSLHMSGRIDILQLHFCPLKIISFLESLCSGQEFISLT